MFYRVTQISYQQYQTVWIVEADSQEEADDKRFDLEPIRQVVEIIISRMSVPQSLPEVLQC